MNLIRTSFFTTLSTIVSFISGFILIKFIAVKIGPGGIAQLGQFQNTTALFSMIGTASISVGVVKYLSQFKDDNLKKQQLISTAAIIITILSILTSILVIAFSKMLSLIAFHDYNYWKVYTLFGISLTLISLNTLFASIFNGLKEIKKLTLIGISGAFLNIMFTVFLANVLGVTGVLMAISFTAFILFIINFLVFKNIKDLSFNFTFKLFNKKLLILLLSYTMMSVISSALIPISQLLIRNFIINKLTLTDAGNWQAISKISEYYLAFITTVLGVYYLPTLSGIDTKKDLKIEILKGYKIILPIVAILAFSIFSFKSLIIKTLFTREFSGMDKLFLFQMIGDFLKIGSWLLAYLMLAKAMIKIFIITEIMFTVSLVVFTYLFVSKFGLVGTTYAFALNYLLYWICMAIIMKQYFKVQPDSYDL
jgi:O-antigen/teichoic acid export membrane protein